MSYLENDWLDKVSNIAQVGGIETSVLDNGGGRGVRIAWINTGAGLRFKVVLDRAMDIAEASYHQFNLTWISQQGVVPAQPLADKGIDWLKTFSGGLLVTCGLTHVGGPEEDDFGCRGLHDRISNISAEIIQIKQPNLLDGDREMFITGIIKQAVPFHPSLELKRTIRCYLGEPTIYIEDEVINVGNVDSPHMLLYHFNFGWPLIDKGTELLWDGTWQAREEGKQNKIFKDGNDYKICPAPLEDHKGAGEEAVFIDVVSDGHGDSLCGIYNSKLGIALKLGFKKNELPWLTNWQHWGKGEYVTGLEPGTNPPLGQKYARENNQLIVLKPKEKRKYHVTLSVFDEQNAIQEFINHK